jgi:hypothetical protein
MKTTGFEVMAEGGRWLGATREYLQTHAMHGDSLEWGSSDAVKGLTVSEIEELVADAIAADRNERAAKIWADV